MFKEKYLKDDKGHYFTGLPCLRGHISNRNSEGSCTDCIKIKGKEYNEKNKPFIKIRRHIRHKNLRIKIPYLQLLKNAKKRAKRKNISYSLTLEWAKSTWNGKCELTLIPFDLSFNGERAGWFMPSLDRIDNLQGYTPSNCRFILYALNAFKGELSDKEFFSIAADLIANKGQPHG